jgi:hypothetical protein
VVKEPVGVATLLRAALSSGNEGTIRLAAQLGGVQPCKVCDFVWYRCRCSEKYINIKLNDPSMSNDKQANSFFLVESIYNRNNLANIKQGNIVRIGDRLYVNTTGNNGCDDDWEEILPPVMPDMRYDPSTGVEKPSIRTINMYRLNHKTRAWFFNPWTGVKRDPEEVGLDPYGYTVNPPIIVETEDATILIIANK